MRFTFQQRDACIYFITRLSVRNPGDDRLFATVISTDPDGHTCPVNRGKRCFTENGTWLPSTPAYLHTHESTVLRLSMHKWFQQWNLYWFQPLTRVSVMYAYCSLRLLDITQMSEIDKLKINVKTGCVPTDLQIHREFLVYFPIIVQSKTTARLFFYFFYFFYFFFLFDRRTKGCSSI